jgi:hypothetical protein
MAFFLDCVRVGVLPAKSGRRYDIKIERYLLLALALFVLLVLCTFFKR